MELEQLAKIFEAVKVLPFRPQDIIVIKVMQWLTDEQRKLIQQTWRDLVSEQKVIVLDGGLDIEVLRKEERTDSTAFGTINEEFDDWAGASRP